MKMIHATRLTAARARLAQVVVVGSDAWDALPDALAAALAQRLGSGVAGVATLGLVPAPMVVAVKPPAATDSVAWRRYGGRVARALEADGHTSAACCLPSNLARADAHQLLVGIGMGAYADDRYRSAPARLRQVVVIGGGAKLVAAAGDEIAATALARDLVNCPAGDLGPAEFEAEARGVAKAAGLRFKLLNEAACRKLGMGCLLGVGQASPRRPRLAVLESPAGVGRGKPLALVGKGVCFDTGGLGIKPAAGMRLMRKDMGGAATVLAAMQLAAARGFNRPVRAYLPLVDNAIDGTAMRPGDILTAMDGTTVEIGHTDAEGRLILADAMALAKRDGAAEMITVATLTGAALYALGRVRVPIMGHDDALIGRLEAAAEAAGERVWRLPFDDDYHRLVRGKVAQLTNSSGQPDAGCITAGCFLNHFAGQVPFAHCDISPASWQEGAHDLGPAGATGVLVASLARLVS